jgi:hypothetical protein
VKYKILVILVGNEIETMLDRYVRPTRNEHPEREPRQASEIAQQVEYLLQAALLALI